MAGREVIGRSILEDSRTTLVAELENCWERVENNGDDHEHYDYFPVWRGGVGR